MSTTKNIITIAIALGAGLAMGRYLLPVGHESGMQTSPGGNEVLYWVAPMDPNYRSDNPGKSPMGMDLIPVYAEDEMASGGDIINISPQVVQNIGVKSAPVTMGALSRAVDTVGFVAINEDLTSHIHVRSMGWIEDLRIRAEGEQVKKGELLFRFYSPDIANAKSELVRALSVNNSALINASKSRLRALDVPSDQIEAIVSNKQADELVNVYAPQDGIVAVLNVAEGMHIQPGTTILSLADLASVWINAEVFEDQAPWLADGAHAMVTVPFMPDRMWHGRVDYIYPTVDQKTRTIRARLVFENADIVLKPGMYAEVAIDVAPIHHALTIPRSALIQTGASNRVILDLGEGKFRPALVSVGMESGDRVQIVSGLNAGDMVVTSAQFLIDSEASLSGSFARMEGEAVEGEAIDHSQHSMPENPQPEETDHSQMDHSQMRDGQMRDGQMDNGGRK